MNQFTVLVLVLVVFCYFGGKYCPAVLKKNKQILLGVVGGLVLASFFGLKLETYGHSGGDNLTQDQVWELCEVECSALSNPEARRLYDINCADGHGYQTYSDKCQ